MNDNEKPRIGVYICWCGSNIAKMVDVQLLSKEFVNLPNVIISRDYQYMCSDPGQDLVVKDVRENRLNRIVVAACSPRMHEATFRRALIKAGINPYFLEMANIREQDAWVHDDREAATAKARALIHGAIRRVALHEPLERRSVGIVPATLVLGGGVAGITAALEIAGAGHQVFLVERAHQLGGYSREIDLTYPEMTSARKMVEEKIREVESNPNIEVHLGSTVKEVAGYIGNFDARIVTVGNGGRETEIKIGHIVVATGLDVFDPSVIPEYGYGLLPNVVTSLEFEKMLGEGRILTAAGKEPRTIAIVHCVGSMHPKYNNYCSRNCCITALKFSNQIRAALPQTHIAHIYSDMRVFGKDSEEFYDETARKSVRFMMFKKGDLPKIWKAPSGSPNELFLEMNEQFSGEAIEIPADLVVLMVGVEARKDAQDVAHVVGICLCQRAFFIERHPKLDPVGTTTEGVFIAGGCQGPKGIAESVSQARAAAARILSTITQGSVEVEAATAMVNEKLCSGCLTCTLVCPYKAVSYDETLRSSVVNEVLCKGCGTCGATCPSGAIRCRHFSDPQIMAQIEGLVAGGRS